MKRYYIEIYEDIHELPFNCEVLAESKGEAEAIAGDLVRSRGATGCDVTVEEIQ